jgi:hypothetical protein
VLLPDDEPLSATWLAGARARFAADNDELVPQTRSALARIVGEPARHARLLNTLSMLEQLGSRKIAVTQPAADIDQPTLKHVAEEAHHAYFLKRQAEKVGTRPMKYVAGDLLAPATARMYFQRLEAAVRRTLKDQRSARAVYLYLSMIIEFRALWFYELYQEMLERAAHPLTVKRVLREEQGHLADIAGRLDGAGERSDVRTALFLTAEKRLYRRLLDALQRG